MRVLSSFLGNTSFAPSGSADGLDTLKSTCFRDNLVERQAHYVFSFFPYQAGKGLVYASDNMPVTLDRCRRQV
jgi:hypothetical protein